MRCLLLLCGLLFAGALSAHAGLTSYTDRGKTDFDTALQVLNPYGAWSKIDGSWAYTPRDHYAPYTEGRWIYTEYGWYWKGAKPHSWVTEHYGYWKRGADKVWSWFPGPYWLPQIVELRIMPQAIGWRSAAVNEDGAFIERPAERYAKTDEWTFVTYPQFAGAITPGIAAKPEAVGALLEDSTECRHLYYTYREIDRPGPHPADFVAFAGEGGMFAPHTLEDKLAAQPPPPSLVQIHPELQKQISSMTGTNTVVALPPGQDNAKDKRKVKYWITMSLPSYWAKPPPEAKAEEVYFYRPDFFQDDDGIARRISLWFNPKARVSLKEALAIGGKLTGDPETTTNKAPAAPEPSKSSDAFRSPLEDPYRPASGVSARDSGSGPIPSPLVNATNAAPAPDGRR